MKILCVRIGRMGDLLMAMPAILAIQQQFPQATIDFLTSHDGKRILIQADINTGTIHIYDNHFFSRYSQKKNLKKFLLANQYERIYIFEMKNRYRDFFKNNACHHIFYRNDDLKHDSENNLQVLSISEQEIISWKSKKLLNPSVESKILLEKELSKYGINKDTTIIAFHPSYSGVTKSKKDYQDKVWPSSHWAELANFLHIYAQKHKKDIRIICDLLPVEYAIATSIKNACGDLVLVLQNKPNFSRYLAYVDRVNCMIAPNTGAMHLAAALNTPVIALFSHFSPKICGPFALKDQMAILQAEDYQDGQLGLARIPPEAVFSTIQDLQLI